MRVAVVGAGVIGLSSAQSVYERCRHEAPDLHITVYAEAFSPHTTGDGSAGFWQPYALGEMSPAQKKWNKETFDYLLGLVNSPEASEMGLFLQSGYNLFANPVPDPAWKDIVLGFRHLTIDELKMFPGWSYGWFNTTLMLECKKYLPWLMNKLKSYGVQFIQKKIHSFSELSASYDVILNCTGVWAGDLQPDPLLQPARGQLMKVFAPWIKHFIVTHDTNKGVYETPYILPGSSGVVALGGCFQVGNWNQGIDKKDRANIWEGCCNLVPSLSKARLVEEWAGLRPARHAIRLERESLRQGGAVQSEIIHNYGHGGYGVTIHWGCALELANIFRQIALEKKHGPHSRL